MKFECIRQTDLSSCGPTCIQMICQYYGKKIPLEIINEHVGLTNIGASVRDLNDALKSLRLQSVVVECPIEKLAKIPLPAILYWRNNHFVVLYKTSDRYFYVADPASGKVRFSKNEFLINWARDNSAGTVILVAPTPEFEKKEYLEPISSWKDVLREIVTGTLQNKTKMVLVMLLILLSCGCSWYIPVLYKDLIDKGVLVGNLIIVFSLFSVWFAFFLGNLLFTSISSLLVLRINSSLAISYLKDLLVKIVRLPLKFFDYSLHTEIIQRLEDFRRVQTFVSDILVTEFVSILSLLVFSVLLLLYNYVAVIIFYTLSIVSIAVNFYYLKERRYIDYTRLAQASRNFNYALEMLQGMRDIKICGAEKLYVSHWEGTQAEINALDVKSSIIEYKQTTWYSSINKFRDICIIGFCSFIAIDGNLTMGTLISTTYLLGMMSAPMDRLTQVFRKYQNAKISAERISKLKSKEDERNGESVPCFEGDISLTNVSFKYPGNRSGYILSDLSFTIPHGKVTAFVGRSGCGKTTLMKLLLGFYSPQDGEIRIGKDNLENLNLQDWRQGCGTVFQDGFIFSGTIAENIAMTDEIDNELLFRVAKLACVDDYVLRLPLKYKTPIGASGQDLSQGQKQRILIARALYKCPKVVFFDEATSSLDSDNEKQIMENIFSFCEGKTLIVIAHRLSTIKNADNIVVIDKGRIVEIGNHRQLLSNKGFYYNLVKNQIG